MTQYPTPSELMRAKRPYLYSDRTVTDAHELSRSEFSHFLDTLTERNQHKDFENFVRRLCERELCPNLRTQTGPEGGGDGKIDTETYPVAEEVSERWFVGEANSGTERWAFAISTMKRWSAKVRSDIDGIVQTGRAYDRIFFVTSRPVRAKDGLRIEQELRDKYDIPVTILDREWIIEKTLVNRHKDLAFEKLGAGKYVPDKLEYGPHDIERQRELDNIEKSLATSGTLHKDLNTAIADSYKAACLSRELEKPRHETEGRFLRAIKFAEKHGSKSQVIRARYECAWTGLWWFDDVSTINDQYETIEELAFESCLAEDASRICNLFQVMVGRYRQGWETAEELNIGNRSDRLREKLAEIASNKSLPNNALYGEALVELHRLTAIPPESVDTESSDIWKKLTKIVEKAKGMGEFPAQMLDEVVEALSPYVTESATFDRLLEKLAEFMGDRQRDGKAGSIYLSRGRQKLEAEQPIEAIGWLGKASIHFMKEEYREEQFETLYLLAIAYRGAGLLWAARATVLGALVQINALSEHAGELRSELIPTISTFAHVSLQLARIPDFLFAIMWLKSLQSALQLSDDGAKNLSENLQELDQLLSCLLANFDQSNLEFLESVPDMLGSQEFFFSQMVLLYRLGHAQQLRDEGSMPDSASISELRNITEMLTMQPAAPSLPKIGLFNKPALTEIKTNVLGVEVCISSRNEIGNILICEAHISALEGFVATALKHGALPHAEHLKISIEPSAELEEPKISFDAETMHLAVKWPQTWSIDNVEFHGKISSHLLMFCGLAFGAIAILDDTESFETMIKDELALERAISFSNACMSNHRVFGQHASSLENLEYLTCKKYPLTTDAPDVRKPEDTNSNISGSDNETPDHTDPKRHDQIKVHSIINMHLWNKAGWTGMFYASMGDNAPPVLALFFKDRENGEAIFKAWSKRFQGEDENDEIRIALLKGIDRNNVHFYRAHIMRNRKSIGESESFDKTFFMITRMLTMEPDNSSNLDRFLSDYKKTRSYFLLPVFMKPNGEPEMLNKYAVKKTDLHVVDAWKVGPRDDDMPAIREDDNVLVPDGVIDPPFSKISGLRQALKDRHS